MNGSCDTHVSTTVDPYGNASALAKRKANRPIVQRLLQRPANLAVSISINKGNCVSVPLIGQFWTVATSARNLMIALVAGGGFERPTFGL